MNWSECVRHEVDVVLVRRNNAGAPQRFVSSIGFMRSEDRCHTRQRGKRRQLMAEWELYCDTPTAVLVRRHQELERQALECTVGQGRAGSSRAGVVMRFWTHEGTC